MEKYDEIKEIYEKKFTQSKTASVDSKSDEQFRFLLFAIEQYKRIHDTKNSKDMKILDAACGNGKYANKLVELGYRNVHAIDLFENISEPSVSYTKGSIDRIPFQNESFDLIYCTSALYYLKDPVNGIREFSRCLKKDGVLLLTVTTKYSLHTLVRILRKLFRTKGSEHLDFYHFRYSIFRYRRMLKQESFVILWIDGFWLMARDYVMLVIRKMIRILKNDPSYTFQNRRIISRSRRAGLYKAVFGYHTVIIARKTC